MSKENAPLSRKEEEEKAAAEQQNNSGLLSGSLNSTYNKWLNKYSPLGSGSMFKKKQKPAQPVITEISQPDITTGNGEQVLDVTLTFEEQNLTDVQQITDNFTETAIAEIPENETVIAEESVEQMEETLPEAVHPDGITATQRDGKWVIETPGYDRKWYNKAWREVGNYITINGNETWIWRRPDGYGHFQEDTYGYKLSTAEAFYNFQHITAAEAFAWLPRLQAITGDSYYSSIVKKRPRDPSLTQAFTDLVQLTQQKIYPKNNSLHTGKLTVATQQDIAKFEKETERKKGEAQAKELQLSDEQNVTLPKINVPKQELSIGEKITRETLRAYMDLMYGPFIDPMIANYQKQPANMRGKIILAQYKSISKELGTPGVAPEWSTWLSPLDTLWPLFRGVGSGYYAQLGTMSVKQTDTVVMNLMTALKDPDYLIGSFYGIFPGIGKWFSDLWEMVKSLIDLPGQIIEFFGTAIPNAFGSAASWLAGHSKELMQLFKALLTDPELLNSMMASAATAVKSALHEAGKSAGMFLGKAMIEFGSLSHYDMGVKMGGIVGYIIPEILLAIFTEGIGFVVKQGANAARTIMAALKIGKTVGKGFELLKNFFGTLMKLLRGVMGKLKATGQAGMEKLLEFLEGIKKYLGLGDEVADVARVDNLADTRPDFARNIDEATELEAKRKADAEYKDKTDSQADEKAKVYAEAIIITKAADVIDIPVEELLTTLQAMAKSAGVEATFKSKDLGFNAEGEHLFEIVMNPIIAIYFLGGKGRLSGKARAEMEQQLERARNAGLYNSQYRERFEKLKTLVADFKNRTFKLGELVIQLDQEALAHIFGRHHPDYFISRPSVPVQSFLPSKFNLDNFIDLFEKLERACKKDATIVNKLIKNMRGGYGESYVKIDGVIYQIGFNKHSPYQLFPIEIKNIQNYTPDLIININ